MSGFGAIARRGRQAEAVGLLDDAWSALLEEARALFEDDASVAEDPEQHRDTVERYLGLLDEIRRNLAQIEVMLPSRGADADALRTSFDAYVRRYNSLALGVARDSQAETPGALPRTFGWAPVLVVAGVALGVSAVAWAVVAYEEALATRDETALMLADLRERAAASREGRTLQASTVNTTGPGKKEASLWPLAVGALGTVGLGLALYQASRTLRS